MNQILENKLNKIENLKNSKISYTKNIKKFKSIFWFSIIVILICIIFYSFIKYNTSKKEQFAKSLVNQFDITTLYSNNYSTARLSNTTNQNNNFVIGLIKIDKINLFYPILSNTTEENLKISPCRFYGPMPNEIGNLCIAGHNYDDNSFFSNLYKLNIGDEIRIYDSFNLLIKYHIYDKYETSKKDTSCTSQDTNGNKEITLVTCNNFNGNRLIIKAKE